MDKHRDIIVQAVIDSFNSLIETYMTENHLTKEECITLMDFGVWAQQVFTGVQRNG